VTCTKYFWAQDQDGNALPFDAYFVLVKWDGSQWVVEGTYTIPRGGYYSKTGLLDYPQLYQARPLLDTRYEDDWTRPNDKNFTCQSPDITFVYEAIVPPPATVTIDVRVVDQDNVIVAGSQVTIPEALGAKTIATNMSGVAAGFTLTEGATFTATAAPPNGYTSNPGSTGSDVASGSMTITRTLTKTPLPIVCVPSIPDLELPRVPLTMANGALRIGTLDPVTFAADMSCTEDGSPVLIWYPFTVTTRIADVIESTVTVIQGTNTIDIGPDLLALILLGEIDSTTTSIPYKLEYPAEIVDGVPSSELKTITGTIEIVQPVPTICIPSITGLNLPRVPLTLTNGAPGIGTVDPITFAGSMSCTKGGVAVTPTFPFSAVVRLHGDEDLKDGVGDVISSTIDVGEGGNEITDLAMDLFTLLVTGKININTQSLHYEIEYPSEIVDGVPSVETKTVSGTIEVVPPVSVICDLSVYASDPGIIPIDIPAIGLPVPGVSTIPITATFSAVCDNGAPEDLLSYINAEVRVNNILFGTIRPDSTGVIDFDLMSNTNWLSSINLGDSTMELKITFPAQLKCTTPTPYGGTQDYTKPLQIEVTGPPPPGPVICLPSIPADTVTHPPNIQLSPPVIEGGLPTLDPVSDPVTFRAYMSCSQDGASVTPIFPFYAEFFIEEYKVGDIAVYLGINTIPIATLTAAINEAIAAGKITLAMSSFLIKLKYPTRIEDGVPGEYTTIGKTIDITPPGVPPAPIVCNITNVVEKESLIVTLSELGIPAVDPCDIDVQLYITPPCGKSMAEILAVTGGYLSLNHADGTSFASVPLDIYGEGVLDIAPYARNWMLSLTEIPTSLDLVLVCPTKVTFSTPVAEYEDVPVIVGIQVTGPPVPPECVLTDADFFTCPDGTVIQINECVNGVKVPIVPTPTCPPAPPPPAVARAMVMAIPNIVPEGRTVEIVVQALCAGVESDGEDATLLVDDAAVMTRPTAAGEVSFRWVATGIGTRMVCVSIPANPACPYPGAVCKSINVVTYLPEVKEQVELELGEYETELAKLRAAREIEREKLRGVAVPRGTIRVPSSLAGATVVIDGVPRVVPPEGISVPVPAGENIVTIIREGVREIVPVPVLPGETETLPWGS